MPDLHEPTSVLVNGATAYRCHRVGAHVLSPSRRVSTEPPRVAAQRPSRATTVGEKLEKKRKQVPPSRH